MEIKKEFLLANVTDVNSKAMLATVSKVAANTGIALSTEQLYELTETRKEILADEEIL